MKVTLQHLTKKFPNRNKKAGGDVVAVNDFTFEIPDGKLIGLLGPSGCGKSTALNLISGLLEPTAGQIFFGEDDVTHLPPENRGVGLVFQNYALYPHLTVRQNIMFPLENLRGADKLTKAEMAERTLAAAKLVQLEGLMDRKPSELSGGQQQRVAIARALVKRPRVLLLDEPLSNLDARLRLQTREEIRRIQREAGITTVVVTHDQEEASSIADRVVLLRDGVLQQEDTARGLYENPVNLFAADFLGTPPINQLHGIVQNGRLVLDGGIPAALALPDGLAEGQEIVLAVRAESILPQGDTPAFRTTVLERYSLGKDELVRLQAGPAELRGLVPAELEILPGAELAVGLKKRGVFLFDAKTGVRYL